MFKNTLLQLAQNERMRDFVVQNPLARGASRRFVAGEGLDEALEAARVLNRRGLQVALDMLGENVVTVPDVRKSSESYQKAIDLIAKTGLDANISVKLTALGLDISRELCEEQLAVILECGQERNVFVCVDMESSAYTEATLDIVLNAHRQFQNVGTVLQTYLYRTAGDVERLLESGIRLRLVKGAYQESPEIAFQQKDDVDQSYHFLMRVLLAKGNFPAIATHDERLIRSACAFVRECGISKDLFEFQMLYGIRRDLQEQLCQQGYHVRVYVPYGVQWYPYLMRRMAERPANLMFVVSNIWH